MVVFTCSACGDSVKKNQVEKHGLKCGKMSVLTCMDCQKDFSGDAYKVHTKCISEQQKYSAEGWQPKASQNKGERMQQQWVGMVQTILNEEAESIPMESKALLETLSKHPNIPRKKIRYENFVKNILKNQVNADAMENVWNLIVAAWRKRRAEVAKKKAEEGDGKKPEEKKKRKRKAEDDAMEVDGAKKAKVENGDATGKKKKKKHKKKKNAAAVTTEGGKKEVAKKESGETEKKEGEEGKGKRKRVRKRGKKGREVKDGETEAKGSEGETSMETDEKSPGDKSPETKSKKKRNRKRKKAGEEVPTTNGTVSKGENDKSMPNGVSASKKSDKGKGTVNLKGGTKKRKLDWNTSVEDVLKKKKEAQTTLKRLTREILRNYDCLDGQDKQITFSQFRTLLEDKIAATPKFKLEGGIVALAE